MRLTKADYFTMLVLLISNEYRYIALNEDEQVYLYKSKPRVHKNLHKYVPADTESAIPTIFDAKIFKGTLWHISLVCLDTYRDKMI